MIIGFFLKGIKRKSVLKRAKINVVGLEHEDLRYLAVYILKYSKS